MDTLGATGKPGSSWNSGVHCDSLRRDEARYGPEALKRFELGRRCECGPRSGQHRNRRSKYRAVARAYLRAAQAYMLISMPTGTSTIFGVFQAISDLLSNGTADLPYRKKR